MLKTADSSYRLVSNGICRNCKSWVPEEARVPEINLKTELPGARTKQKGTLCLNTVSCNRRLENRRDPDRDR